MGALVSPRLAPTLSATLGQHARMSPASSLPALSSTHLHEFPGEALGELVLSPARAGDHVEIKQLLYGIFRGPTAAEFQAQQDQRSYDVSQRLVVRDGDRIVAHVRVACHSLSVQGEPLPSMRVFDLCTLPAYRGRQLATHLLRAVERWARERGAVLLQAESPCLGLFGRCDWYSAGTASCHVFGPREILAEVERRRWELAMQHHASDDLPQLQRTRHPLTVRRWKQTEHAAIHRLYLEGIGGLTGPLVRSDDDWRWLIGRQAYDWLYVAIDGPDRTLFDDIQGHIVGYMFLKGSRIIELVASAANDRAGEALLVRACRDAVEQSAHPLRFNAPPRHALQELIAAASGTVEHRAVADGELQLLKVLDLPRLARAALSSCFAATPSMTLELRNDARTIPPRGESRTGARQRFTVDQRGLTPADADVRRPQVVCSAATLSRLLLGQQTLDDALESGAVRVSSRAVREAWGEWLGGRTWWWPSLDDLPA